MSSFDTQQQTQARSTQARSQPQQRRAPGPSPRKPKASISPAAWAALGGVAAAGIVAIVLATSGNEAAGTAERPALSLVAPGDLDQAASSLAPEQKDAIVAEAKSCKTPLATVRLTKQTAEGSGTLRIRSGNYISPAFTVSDTPIAIAIPFPAPYPTGKGEIGIEGVTKDVSVQLTPSWTLNPSQNNQTMPVVWKTNKPCG